LDAVVQRHPEGLVMSAKREGDVATLRQRIIDHFETSMIDGELLVPYSKQGQLGEIYESGRVLSESYDETGSKLVVRALPATLARLQRLLSG
jgi:GTP-binding protein HflX